MSSNSVCNHTRDETNRTPATRSSNFVNHSYDYKPNWTPLSPVTITDYPKDSVLSAAERYPSFEQLEPVDNSFRRTSTSERPVYFPF